MLLSDYVSEITEIIREYSQTGLILSSDLTTDFRTEQIGLIRGKITFSDGSGLFFKEYLDLRHGIDKQAYSFHYQDKECELLFRYDNASHKPALGFTEHKHIGDKVLQSEIPNLKEILEEIISNYMLV